MNAHLLVCLIVKCNYTTVHCHNLLHDLSICHCIWLKIKVLKINIVRSVGDTVKSVCKDCSSDPQNTVFKDRWSLQTGELQWELHFQDPERGVSISRWSLRKGSTVFAMPADWTKTSKPAFCFEEVSNQTLGHDGNVLQRQSYYDRD